MAGSLRPLSHGDSNFTIHINGTAERGPRIVHGDHVEDAVLPTVEKDDVSRFNWRRDTCDSQVVASHVVDANRDATRGIRATNHGGSGRPATPAIIASNRKLSGAVA